jgi:hypothetical protein
MQNVTQMPYLFINELQAYTLQHKVYNYNDNSTLPIIQHKPINRTQTYKRKNSKIVLLRILFKVYTGGNMSMHMSCPPQDLETQRLLNT